MMNKEKEMIECNIEISAEFSRYLFEHPELEKNFPLALKLYFCLSLIKN